MTLTRDLQHELDRAQLDYDLIHHRRTETAGEEARAIGVPPEQVAKTVVLVSDDRYARAVLPASEHLDLHKVRQLLGDKHARLASEAESYWPTRCTSWAQFRRSASPQATACCATGGWRSRATSCSRRLRQRIAADEDLRSGGPGTS